MRIIVLLLFLFISHVSWSQDSIFDKISQYFEEYKSEVLKDNGKLWDISFDIPIKIKITNQKIIVLNREVEGFKPYKNLFIGDIDDLDYGEKGEKKWKGQKWVCYDYPLPDNKEERLAFLFHDNFHSLQPEINLAGHWTQCKHLNETEARSMLKREFAALLKALEKEKFKPYLIDALTFRAYRYFLYPNAYIEEQSIEIRERLAQYTGLKLLDCSQSKKTELIKKGLNYNPQTYSYYMGALYGFVLDKSDKDWRKEITKGDNFLYFVQKIFGLQLPDNLKTHMEETRDNYDWKSISKEEKIIDRQTKKLEKIYTNMFFKNSVIKIPSNILTGPMLFHTTIIFPLANGKVYNGFSTSGEWGNLTAKDEIFLGEDILLTTPFVVKDNTITGKGWQIILNKTRGSTF